MQSAIFLWVFLKPYQTHFYMFLLSHRSQYERKSFASSVFLHLSRMMRRGDLKKLYNYNTPKETHWDETQLQFKSVSRWVTGPGFTCRRPLCPHIIYLISDPVNKRRCECKMVRASTFANAADEVSGNVLVVYPPGGQMENYVSGGPLAVRREITLN